MRIKLENWMYVALILGLLQAAEFLYNRGIKLAAQITALAAIALAIVWLASLVFKLTFRASNR